MFLGAVVELVGVGSIVPFMMLMSKPEKILTHPMGAKVFNFFAVTEPSDVVIFASVAFLLAMLLVNVFRLITLYTVSSISGSICNHFYHCLFKLYLHKDYLFHSVTNSSTMRDNICAECTRAAGAINSQFSIAIDICVSVFIGIGLLCFDATVFVSSLLIFGTIYYVVQRITKKRVQMYGRIVSNSIFQRGKLTYEGLVGIQDVKLVNKEQVYLDKFTTAMDKSLYANVRTAFLSTSPRYIVEWVVFFLFVAYLLLAYTKGNNVQDIMPNLALYVIAGMRVMPRFQSIYARLTNIRNLESSFERIGDELYEALDFFNEEEKAEPHVPILFERSLAVQNVSFAYPSEKNKQVLQDVSFTIKKNSSVGLVGESGSGKSTIMYLLAGLFQPDSGSVVVDDQRLDSTHLRSWYSHIGYVPQMIFLADISIAENIAFGLDSETLDMDKVREAAEKAEIATFIETLPEGYATLVGESGVRLSGGQRQRIGIARALYNDPEVLFFDEATSALDGETEQAIMDTMKRFANEKTIVMVAHRFSTVKDCSAIFFFDKGKIVDSGTYEDVLMRNAKLQRMAGVHSSE
jgi:HlyD family secretion protein